MIASRSGGRHSARGVASVLGAMAGVAACAWILYDWPALQQTYWWYPETGAYQIWVIFLVALAALSHWRWDHSGRPERAAISLVWLLAAAMLLSGVAALAVRTHALMLPGDLLQNYLEGARRAAGGDPVYDVAGLKQGVNASPLAIALHAPLAHLSDRDAVAGYLALNAAALGAFFAGACLLVRRIKGRLSLPDVLLPLAGAVTFCTFQRSWRLGQLDTILLALLTLGLALLPLTRSRSRSRSRSRPTAHGPRPTTHGHAPRPTAQAHWSGLASAPLAALAAGLKLMPGLVAGPLLVLGARSLLGREPLVRRRRLAWVGLFLGALALLAAIGVARVGPTAAADFVRNVPRVSQGTTSGNNYSLISRVYTFNDREIRASHGLLPPAYNRAGTALTAVTLVLLCLLSWRLHRADLTLLAAIWLAALPLCSPVCWDIYMLWCSFLPWLVLWAHASGRPALLAGAPRAAHGLLGATVAGAYLLAGTVGNTSHRDIRTGVVTPLDLPVWLEELPLAGHLLLLVALVLLATRDHRLSREDSP